jgi:flagellar biosynthesis/type III secretory pathway protein FliH
VANLKNQTNEPIERLLARAREEGYSNGWKAGKAVGYKIGLEDRQDIGMTEGKEIGFAQGKAAGLKEGKVQGQKGKRETWQDWDAWDDGFQQGLELGILRERGEWPQEFAPSGAQRNGQT